MTPDEKHKEYFEKNPEGNHDKPSRETLKLLHDLERRLEEKRDTELAQINSKLDSKIDTKDFAWVLGLLMTVVLGILGIIYTRVENIYEKTNETNNTVSQIQGKLEPFNFITN